MTVLTSPVSLSPALADALSPARAADGWPLGVSRPPADLPETDGEPLDSDWQRDAMNLVIELIRFLFAGRKDFFVGGNMFIYFSAHQARNTNFKGPDVFFVKDADGTRDRKYWAIWDENGRYPNWILELLSPTTAKTDRTVKKDVYEQTFRTPEYFLYDPEEERLEGWRLDAHQQYESILADHRGWMWSEQLGVWLGTWRGEFQQNLENVWLRFFTDAGELVPLFAEHQAARADEATDRAARAETEVARLKALLATMQVTSPPSSNP